METIKTTDLKVGDIFTKEVKLHGRVVYKVDELKPGKDYMMVTDRTTGKPLKFNFKWIPYIIKLK